MRGEHDLDRPAFARCWQPTFSTFIALGNSDLDLARALATRALDLSTTHDIPSYVAWNRCIIAIHDMANGNFERAFEQFRAAGREAAETEFGWGQPTFRVEMAKAVLGRGRVEAARQICGEVAEVLSTTRELWWQAEALRTEGDVCVAEGNRDGAETLYRKAIEIARSQGARTWELRSEASLAALGSGVDSRIDDMLHRTLHGLE